MTYIRKAGIRIKNSKRRRGSKGRLLREPCGVYSKKFSSPALFLCRHTVCTQSRIDKYLPSGPQEPSL